MQLSVYRFKIATFENSGCRVKVSQNINFEEFYPENSMNRNQKQVMERGGKAALNDTLVVSRFMFYGSWHPQKWNSIASEK